MAEMAYSPYLFAPDQKLPDKTFLSAKFGELRFEKLSEAKKKAPYDLEEAKQRYVREVVMFNPSYVSSLIYLATK